MADVFTVVVVHRDDMEPAGARLTAIDWGHPCSICDCTEQFTHINGEGGVFEGDEAACVNCGAIDSWRCEDGLAYLAQEPVEAAQIRVLRKVFDRAFWAEKAAEQDLELKVVHRAMEVSHG